MARLDSQPRLKLYTCVVLAAAAALTAHSRPSHIGHYAPGDSIVCRLAATAIT